MNGTIEHHNSLSFHALCAKFQSNQHHGKETAHITAESTTTIQPPPPPEIIIVKKKSINAIPRQITTVTRNINELSDHFPLKRNHSNLPSSKTTPSLWSSSNSSITAEEEEYEEDIEELYHSTLGIRAVPRTGSFVTELSKRLAQSEKKGEPVSHIIPPYNILSMRRSAPNLVAEQQQEDIMPPLPMTPSSIQQYHIRKSVPASTSSPSLAIRRSTTGTSVHSIASSSIASISAATSKQQQQQQQQQQKNWHFTHWFSHPPLPIISSTTDAVIEKQPTTKEPQAVAVKRARVIQELLTTEKTYQADMELIQEIYYDEASETFSKIEIKHIFINLLDIIAFEKEFIHMLDTACCQEEEEITIGIAFSMMMNRMDHIYGDYCKKHEDAVCKIQELSTRPNVQAFFSKCKDKIQGRTMCWDLPSLLIKPVQRVLKYPLLLKEIVASTPENHPDYKQLIMVTQEIQQMADHINEIKRRKDLVEQLIADKKKIDRNVVQGINKRFIRRVHRKKQNLGTQDTLFDDLYKQFESRQEIARQFEIGVQEWVYQIKRNIHAISDLVHGLEAVYGDSDGIGLRSIHSFKQLVSQLETNSMETMIQESVYNRIEAYLKLFKGPSHIIQKRNRKLLDYDRAQHLISKGEVPDKQLSIATEQYISLNAHLLDELPTFLQLTVTYFDIIIEEFTRVQATYWRTSRLEWRTLTIELPFGKEHTWSSIGADYSHTMQRIQPCINKIISNPARCEVQAVEENECSYSLQQILSLTSSIDEDPQPQIEKKRPTPINNKYDSLFSESQPVFQCVALVDYESPERLEIHQGDLIQIWLPTKNMATSSDCKTTISTENTPTEWWYGSLASPHEGGDPIYGWLPSNICERI